MENTKLVKKTSKKKYLYKLKIKSQTLTRSLNMYLLKFIKNTYNTYYI